MFWRLVLFADVPQLFRRLATQFPTTYYTPLVVDAISSCGHRPAWPCILLQGCSLLFLRALKVVRDRSFIYFEARQVAVTYLSNYQLYSVKKLVVVKDHRYDHVNVDLWHHISNLFRLTSLDFRIDFCWGFFWGHHQHQFHVFLYFSFSSNRVNLNWHHVFAFLIKLVAPGPPTTFYTSISIQYETISCQSFSFLYHILLQ